MAKRRRRKRFTAKHGKTAYCRMMTASNCTVKIGGRRYKGKGRYCPRGQVRVCPVPRGRRTVYKIAPNSGGLKTLHKVPQRRRRRRR